MDRNEVRVETVQSKSRGATSMLIDSAPFITARATNRARCRDRWGSNDLPDMYAAADVVVMASRPGPAGEVEGFGIVYLEAAASDLPWGIEDHLRIIDHLDVKLDDPETAIRMGIAGRARVVAEFERSTARNRAVHLLEASVRAGVTGSRRMRRQRRGIRTSRPLLRGQSVDRD